jgi:Dolichyl-phosphate-mannose-protein mannosyltransferase
VPEFVAHVALAVVTFLAWFGLGSVVLVRGPRVGDVLLDLLNRVGIGAICFALLTFATGWGRVLYPVPYLILFTSAAVVGVTAVARALPPAQFPRLRTWARWERALLALIFLYIALDLFVTAAPISSPDALLYHAANPALFEQHHRIFEVTSNSSSYEPFSVEMLVLDGFLLWDSVQGAFAPLLLAILAVAAVAGFTYRVAGRSAALLAAAIFFAQPFLVWEATSVFIESGLACAVALSIWNLYRFVRHGERAGLVLAGVFAGGAAGMKYLGLVAALGLAAALVILVGKRMNFRTALAFGLPALVVALPWYVKNALLTGNPFYPHVFGGLNPSAAHELDSAMRAFGHGHGPLDFLLLPARLLGDAKSFDAGEFLSPLFLIFAPTALLLSQHRRLVLVAWTGVFCFVAVWFLTTQQARFLVPLMPVLAVLAALGALALAARGRVGRVLVVSGIAGALAVGLGASIVYAAQFAPVVVGAQSRDRFLEEKVSDYDGVEWLNRRLGPNQKVATDIWALLYLKVPYTTFGTMGDLLPLDAGPRATRSFVTREGVTRIAILDTDVDRKRQVGYLDARLIGRVPVRSVKSRTRGEFGPRQDMLVYAIGGTS